MNNGTLATVIRDCSQTLGAAMVQVGDVCFAGRWILAPGCAMRLELWIATPEAAHVLKVLKAR